MRKRIVSMLGAVIMTLSLIPNLKVNANPWSTSVESSKRVISLKMDDLNKKANLGYQGDMGLLHYVDTITRYSLWIDFLKKDNQRTDSLNMGAGELNEYIERYKATIASGNSRYQNMTVNGNKIEYSEGMSIEQIDSLSASVITSILDKIVEEYKQAGNDEAKQNKVKEDNKNVLKYAYRAVYGIQTELEEIRNVIPISNLGNTPSIDVNNGSLLDYRRVWDYSPSLTNITQISNNEKYIDLLAYAKEVSDLDNSSAININLNNAESLVEKFITGTDNKKELTTAYYAALATSSIYVPFQSHAGDELFTETLRALINKDAKTTDEIINAYSQLKSYKKPLYYRECNNNGEGTGNAYLITLADLVSKVTNDNKVELVIAEGKISMSSDTNTYEYYNGMDDINSSGVVNQEQQNNQNQEDNNGEEQQQSQNQQQQQNKPSDGFSVADVGTPISNSGLLMEPVLRLGSYNTMGLDPAVYKNNDSISSANFTQAAHRYRTPETIALSNIFSKSQKAINSINPSNQLLFLNSFGDIVLADDTVVFPGSANFNFYNKGWSYYANTAAIMNYYPANLITGAMSPDSKDAIFNKPSSDMIGMEVVGYLTKEDSEKAYLEAMDKFRREPHSLYTFTVDNEHINASITLTQGWDTRVIINNEIIELMNALKPNYNHSGWLGGFKDWWNDATKGNFRYYQPFPIKSDGFFPAGYNITDENLKKARMIATNMYLVYMTDKEGQVLVDGANDMINDDFVIKQILEQASKGLTNATSLFKSVSESAEYLLDNQGKFMTKTAADLFSMELYNFGDVEGVMGIKTAYQDPFFGSVLGFLRDYFWIVIVAIFLFILAQYMRNSAGFFTAIILACLVSFGAYLTINWVPVVVPNLYNLGVERIADDLAFKSLMYKVEQYDKTYGESAKSDSTGRFSKRTTSVDLMTLTDSQFNDLCERQNLDKRALLSGKAIILDATNGVYIEGKVIKLNVDRLFYTFPITGENVDLGNGLLQYQLSADKMYSSNIDYYMPFYSIAKNLTNSVNSFARIYQLQRETIVYSSDMEKDSFFIKNFMVSIPFLAPGVYTKEDGTPLTENPDEALLLMELEEVFGDELDFLGIRGLLETSDQKIKDTLWYQTAEQNKLLNQKNIDATVARVNNLTKEFMIDNYYNFLQMSDENIIKVVSLFASMQFNGGVSNILNAVHPITLNFEELSLKDVLVCTLVDDYSLFTNTDIDLSQHLVNNYGFFTIVGLIIALIEIFIIVNAIKYLVPALYILFLVLLLWKFKTDDDKVPLVKGYLICSAFVFVSFLIFCGMLAVVEKIAGNSFIAFIMVIVCTVILFILLDVLLGIVRNFTELGYGQYGVFSGAVFNNTILKIPGVKQIVAGLNNGGRHLVNRSLDTYERYGHSPYDSLDDRMVNKVLKDHSNNYQDNKSKYDGTYRR